MNVNDGVHIWIASWNMMHDYLQVQIWVQSWLNVPSTWIFITSVTFCFTTNMQHVPNIWTSKHELQAFSNSSFKEFSKIFHRQYPSYFLGLEGTNCDVNEVVMRIQTGPNVHICPSLDVQWQVVPIGRGSHAWKVYTHFGHWPNPFPTHAGLRRKTQLHPAIIYLSGPKQQHVHILRNPFAEPHRDHRAFGLPPVASWFLTLIKYRY